MAGVVERHAPENRLLRYEDSGDVTQTRNWREKALRLTQVALAMWALGMVAVVHVLPPWQYRKDIIIDYITDSTINTIIGCYDR